MAIVNNGDAMGRPHPVNLSAERAVIGGVVKLNPLANFGLAWFLAHPVKRLAVKPDKRAQPGGVLPWIERNPARVAIKVDHIARQMRPHDSCIGQQPVIEPVDVPVGVSER